MKFPFLTSASDLVGSRAVFPEIRRPWFGMGWAAWSLGVLLVAGGCADRAIEHAFDGDFPPLKSNKVINEYCESCHIHKDFEAEPHMADMREKYRRPYFHQAQECRACHFIEKDWLHNLYDRNTRMPRDANRGKYRDFEIDEMEKIRERKS